jgi:import receptor subunit TOM70
MSNPLPSVRPGQPAVTIPVDAAPSSTFWDRAREWISDNKAVVYTIAGVGIVITGAGVAYYLTPKNQKVSKKERRKRAEAARKAAEDKPTAEKGASSPTRAEAADSVDDLPEITEESVTGMTTDQREQYSKTLKAAGNAAYGDKEYDRAIELYTKAILCKANEPVFYSNRAACNNALNNLEKVVEDCTAALALNPEYSKALNRRAVAYENLQKYNEALLDFTALCIIDNFSNPATAESVEKLLKKVAEQKAKDLLANRPVKLPSYIFVGNYLQSFRERPRPEGLQDTDEISEESGKGQLRHGLGSQEKKTREGYEEARVAFEKAIELGELGEFEALAYNMRGTFRALMGHNDDAIQDFAKSIELDPAMTQSYIKRASIIVEQGLFSEAEEEFRKAIEQDARDPDIYYHRAQAHFLKGEFPEAAKDYQKSIDLDRDFIYSHIQLGVSQYKMGSIASAMATFRRCVKNFPSVPDVYNYYGELLLDQGNHSEAIEKFDTAIDMEKQAKPMGMNVLPLINKALAMFQANQDTQEAEKLCKKALIIDPECDIAIATIAQLLLQQGKVTEALEYFERAAELGRTEGEIVNALSYAEATRTQIAVQEKYPALAAKLQGPGGGAPAGPWGVPS